MPKDIAEELKNLQDKELVSFIRHTVSQLNVLADRLEDYVTEVEQPVVGFAVEPPHEHSDSEVGFSTESLDEGDEPGG